MSVKVAEQALQAAGTVVQAEGHPHLILHQTVAVAVVHQI